jgi:hypothetical protein
MAQASLEQVDAPGLQADWLNAWLAAIGVTVLVPDVKLSWTDDVVPHAVFWVPEGMDLARAVYEALPTEDDLEKMTIAPQGRGGVLGQKVTDEALYRARASHARTCHDTSFECAYTDLAPEPDGSSPIGRGQFNVGMEGKETLWRRLEKCIHALREGDRPVDRIGASLGIRPDGDRPLVGTNGLGFDPRRLPSGLSAPGNWPTVDAAVEIFAFFGIQRLPVRGDGVTVLQKPWLRQGQMRRPSLTYGCWATPLDSWGVDALLDLMLARSSRRESPLPVHSFFRVVRLRNFDGSKKVAYFSEPVS